MSAPIKCLTWNVCWGCMTNNKHDKTARGIAERCARGLREDSDSEAEEAVGERTFICLDNVISTIQAGQYSLIGLQEASNWEKMYENISNLYNYITIKIENSYGALVDLTTFYDKARFTIVELYFGNITRDGSDVRPYQIILFRDSDGKLFYFITTNSDVSFCIQL